MLFGRVLVRLDPEAAHRAAFAGMRAAARVPGVRSWATRRLAPAPGATRPVEALGLTFPGPLGMAAGFDKNAVGIDALAALGFSFVEVGTVTARPQPGNPRPRLFRLVEDRAIVNRMGFNNDGAAAVAARLARRRRRRRSAPVVVGVNIGKSKVVPAEEAIADYEASTRLLAPYADYLVVNVSSPNTPGLRDLQSIDRLRPLMAAVRAAADGVTSAGRTPRRVPLLVKIAPDLADADIVAVADLAVDLGLDGIVATNTTIGRSGLRSPAESVAAAGTGGLSGEPLHARSLEVLRLLRTHVGDAVTLISVGGVSGPDEVRERLEAGAALVQAYTAFIYGGPTWPARAQELT